MLLPLLPVGIHRMHDFQIRPYLDPEPLHLARFRSQPDAVLGKFLFGSGPGLEIL